MGRGMSRQGRVAARRDGGRGVSILPLAVEMRAAFLGRRKLNWQLYINRYPHRASAG